MRRPLRRALLLLLLAAGVRPACAQLLRNGYLNADWQYNVPLGRSFAGGATAWGMHFEGGRYIFPELSVGGFAGWHTNFRTVPRATLHPAPGQALTSARIHALYQLPFGAAVRWTFRRDCVVEPYVGMKAGACYTRITSYGSLFRLGDTAWGALFQPELGVSLFPEPLHRFGLHLAICYGYATGRCEVTGYRSERISQFGVRAGVTF